MVASSGEWESIQLSMQYVFCWDTQYTICNGHQHQMNRIQHTKGKTELNSILSISVHCVWLLWFFLLFSARFILTAFLFMRLIFAFWILNFSIRPRRAKQYVLNHLQTTSQFYGYINNSKYLMIFRRRRNIDAYSCTSRWKFAADYFCEKNCNLYYLREKLFPFARKFNNNVPLHTIEFNCLLHCNLIMNHQWHNVNLIIASVFVYTIFISNCTLLLCAFAESLSYMLWLFLVLFVLCCVHVYQKLTRQHVMFSCLLNWNFSLFFANAKLCDCLPKLPLHIDTK